MTATKHRAALIALLDAVLLATAIHPVTAGAGPAEQPDATFGDNGLLEIEQLAQQVFEGREIRFGLIGSVVAKQPSDGKVVLAAQSLNYARGNSMALFRLNPDGSLDESFGLGGSVEIDFEWDASGQWTAESADAVVVQPDGRIVVAGQIDASYFGTTSNQIIVRQDIGVVRLNTDGSPDRSFGNDGRIRLDLGGQHENVAALALTTDDRIVLLGDASDRVVFVRLLPNGTVDASFGAGPTAGVTIVPSTHRESATGLATLAGGGFIACGASIAQNGTSSMLAVKVFANGVIDTGFGSGGIARLAVGDGSTAYDCLELSPGVTILAGHGGSLSREDIQLAWLGSDGRPDRAYGQDGVARLPVEGSESAQDIIRLADGSVVVIGSTAVLSDYGFPSEWPGFRGRFPNRRPSELLLARFDASSGNLDSSFGDGGVTLIDFGHGDSASWAYGRSVLETDDGKLVGFGTAIDYVNGDGISGEVPRLVAARVGVPSEHAGTIGFSSTFKDAFEGQGQLVVAIRRLGGTLGSLSIDYVTESGTATAGADFTAVSGTLTWADGEASTKTFDVPLIPDYVGEAVEHFRLKLTGANDAIAASEMLIRLTDSPAPAPAVRQPAVQAPAVGGGGGAFGIEALLLLAAVFARKLRRQRCLVDAQKFLSNCLFARPTFGVQPRVGDKASCAKQGVAELAERNPAEGTCAEMP